MKRLITLLLFIGIAVSSFAASAIPICGPGQSTHTYCYTDGLVDEVAFEICPSEGRIVEADINQGEFFEILNDNLTVYSGAAGSGTDGTIVFGPASGDLTTVSGNQDIQSLAAGECLIFVINSNTIEMPVSCADGYFDELAVCSEEKLGMVTFANPGAFNIADLPQANLSGGFPSGGVYSSPTAGAVTDNSDGETFTFTAVNGIGTYELIYTLEGIPANVMVQVYESGEVSFIAPDDLCIDEGELTDLGRGTPSGGVYAGNGVMDDGNGMTYSFDPEVAGEGTTTITYIVGNEGASDEVQVSVPPDITLNTATSYCLDAPIANIPLVGGSPAGGVYSGPGVTDGENGMNYMLDPTVAGPGEITITYTIDDGNGCIVEAESTIEIIACEAAITTACECLENASVIDVDAATGGDDGQFLEVISVIDGEGGMLPANQTWIVTAASGAFDADNIPNAGMQSQGTPVATDGSINLTYNSTAGTYELPFVHNDGVGYSITVVGPFPVGSPVNSTLTFTNNCSYPSPVFDPALQDIYCATSPAITLGGTDAIGADMVTFAIDGSEATVFDPSSLDAEIYQVRMDYQGADDGNNGIAPMNGSAFPGCLQQVQKEVEVSMGTLPEVNLNTVDVYCLDAPISGLPLTGGSPAGGVYSGIGVTDNGGSYSLDPTVGGPGTLAISYTITDDITGCTSTATSTIEIIDCQEEIIQACECLDNASVIDLDNTTGGDDGQFAELIAVVDSEGGMLPANQMWTVTEATGAFDADNIPTPGMQSAGVAIATDGSVMLTYNSDLGSYELEFVHTDAVGYEITVVGPFVAGSPANATLTFANNCSYPNPTFDPALQDRYCIDDAAFTLGGTDAVGADAVSFTVNGTTAFSFDPSASEAGAYDILMTYDGLDDGGANPGCIQQVQKQIEVTDLPEVTLNTVASYCLDAPLTNLPLVGGLPIGGEYSGTGVTDNNGNYNLDPSVGGPGTITITYTYTDPTTGCTNSTTSDIEIINCQEAITQACGCLDNASPIDADAGTGGDDGQFSEVISVVDGEGGMLPSGQIWTVTAAMGAFDADNIPASGVQSAGVPVATDGSVTLNYNSTSGTYELSFVHTDAIGYSLTLVGPFAAGSPANSTLIFTNNCSYPNPSFTTNFADGYCEDDPVVVLAGTDMVGADLISFAIDGSPVTSFDPSSLGAGSYVIEMIYDGLDDGNAFPGCIQRVQKQVAISEQPATPVAEQLTGEICGDETATLSVEAPRAGLEINWMVIAAPVGSSFTTNDILGAGEDGVDYQTNLDVDGRRLLIKGSEAIVMGTYLFQAFTVDPLTGCQSEMLSDIFEVTVGMESTLACPADQTITLITDATTFDCLATATFTNPIVDHGICGAVTLTVSIDGGAPIAVEAGEPFTANFDALGIYEITYTLEDESGNSSSCTFTVTIEGLPCGWVDNGGLGCTDNTSSFDQANETFILGAPDCMPAFPFFEDESAFVFTELCGDGEIFALVSGLDGTGFAGVQVRASEEVGAEKVAIGTNMVDRIRKEIRVLNGYPAYPQPIASFDQFWVRIVRAGDSFFGSASIDGVFWTPYIAQNILMPECVLVGLYTYGEKQASNISASFDNVFVSSLDGENIAGNGGSTTNRLQLERSAESIRLFPNPTSGILSVDLSPYLGGSATIRIFNSIGQQVQAQEIEEIQMSTERLDVSKLEPGVYTIAFKLGDALVTERVVIAR
ncbi:MAG: T9SS type A sorting domain-containing protein [Bacteroidota bacterium]